MNRREEAAEFERWLDRELPRVIATELDTPPPLAIHSRSLARRGIAAICLRGAAALVAIALAALGGAALTTGSPNPVSWGHQVVHAVTVGSLILQRTPAPTPDPPPARSVTRSAATDAPPQQSGGDTAGGGAGADQGDGNQGGAKPGHGDSSPPPDQDRQPKDSGHQQGQNKP